MSVYNYQPAIIDDLVLNFRLGNAIKISTTSTKVDDISAFSTEWNALEKDYRAAIYRKYMPVVWYQTITSSSDSTSKYTYWYFVSDSLGTSTTITSSIIKKVFPYNISGRTDDLGPNTSITLEEFKKWNGYPATNTSNYASYASIAFLGESMSTQVLIRPIGIDSGGVLKAFNVESLVNNYPFRIEDDEQSLSDIINMVDITSGSVETYFLITSVDSITLSGTSPSATIKLTISSYDDLRVILSKSPTKISNFSISPTITATTSSVTATTTIKITADPNYSSSTIADSFTLALQKKKDDTWVTQTTKTISISQPISYRTVKFYLDGTLENTLEVTNGDIYTFDNYYAYYKSSDYSGSVYTYGNSLVVTSDMSFYRRSAGVAALTQWRKITTSSGGSIAAPTVHDYVTFNPKTRTYAFISGKNKVYTSSDGLYFDYAFDLNIPSNDLSIKANNFSGYGFFSPIYNERLGKYIASDNMGLYHYDINSPSDPYINIAEYFLNNDDYNGTAYTSSGYSRKNTVYPLYGVPLPNMSSTTNDSDVVQTLVNVATVNEFYNSTKDYSNIRSQSILFSIDKNGNVKSTTLESDNQIDSHDGTSFSGKMGTYVIQPIVDKISQVDWENSVFRMVPRSFIPLVDGSKPSSVNVYQKYINILIYDKDQLGSECYSTSNTNSYSFWTSGEFGVNYEMHYYLTKKYAGGTSYTILNSTADLGCANSLSWSFYNENYPTLFYLYGTTLRTHGVTLSTYSSYNFTSSNMGDDLGFCVIGDNHSTDEEKINCRGERAPLYVTNDGKYLFFSGSKYGLCYISLLDCGSYTSTGAYTLTTAKSPFSSINNLTRAKNTSGSNQSTPLVNFKEINGHMYASDLNGNYYVAY